MKWLLICLFLTSCLNVGGGTRVEKENYESPLNQDAVELEEGELFPEEEQPRRALRRQT